jgi:predicted phage tail protein
LWVVRKFEKVKRDIEIKNLIHTFPLLRRYLPQGRNQIRKDEKDRGDERVRDLIKKRV